MAVPAITSISPTGGSADGGTTVTITGTALGTPTAVAFGSTPATSFVGLSATKAFAVAPAGTGTVDVRLTTAEGQSPVAAAAKFTYGSALFTVAEARAFDKAQLASVTTFTDAAIVAKEAEIREWLERACGCNFVPTTHTAEIHDGDGSDYLMLKWPLVTSVTAISVDGTAFTAGELSTTDYSLGLAIDPVHGLVTRRSGTFTAGWANVSITYVAGYATVPTLIKRAALLIAVYELPATNLSPAAESYDAEGVSYSFGRGDGYGGNWHKIPEVMKAVRLYDHSLPGIA